MVMHINVPDDQRYVTVNHSNNREEDGTEIAGLVGEVEVRNHLFIYLFLGRGVSRFLNYPGLSPEAKGKWPFFSYALLRMQIFS